MLTTSIFHNAAKHGYDHHGAVNKIKIRQKMQCQANPASKLVFKHITEDTAACSLSNLLSCKRHHFLTQSS